MNDMNLAAAKLAQAVGDTPVGTHPGPPTMRHFPVRVRYESGEHVLLGNTCTLRFPSGDAGGTMKLLPYVDSASSLFHNADSYSFGEVLALGGDFIGDPDHPISDASEPLNQFEASYTQLCDLASNDKAQMAAILDLIHQEVAMLNNLKPGEDSTTVYERIGDSFSLKWNVITGGTNAGPVPVKNGRYLALASKNWDHFGYRAGLCYKAGHQAAVNAALYARNAPTPALAEKLLQAAYARDAFSCHFLTDMFSSGHMRTPRKELDEVCSNSSTAGLLSRAMHDQDSKIGLNVSSLAGQTWTAYGDGHLLTVGNATSTATAKAAVQVSVDEVYAAFTSGQASSAFGALRLAPDLSKVTELNNNGKSPLFVTHWDTGASKASVNVRNSASLDDYTWTGSWHEATTLAWCVKEGLIKLPGA